MIAAIVLAAGAAVRMGRPKQLLPLAGRPLIRHVADVACQAGVDEIIVVTGAEHEAVADTVADLPVRLVYNRDWRSGQASSLRTGLTAVGPDITAAVFLLGDQPLITAALIDELVAAYRAGGSIVVPVREGRRGNPVLFDLVRWREQLAALSGDKGARGVITANPAAVVTVQVADEHVFWDVDTPADYARLLEVYGR